jgi:hypothetical protein
VSCSACFRTDGEPLNYFVREMKIDAKQHLTPVGRKSSQHFDDGSYYMFVHGAIITAVSHWLRHAANGDQRELLYLETDQDQLLERTVKTDRIIAGPFGAVVTERTCFYNRPVETYPSALLVLVQSMRYDIDEVPDTIPAPSKDIAPLTSMAIVRFFRANGELSYASGNYEATGTIGAIQSGKTENGDPVPQDSSTSFPVASAFNRQFNELQRAYGLPSHVEIADFLRSKRSPLLNVSAVEDHAFVFLVYGFGKYIRQDSLNRNGVVTSSRFSRPSFTEEEKTLGPQCDERFREQQTKGIGTLR